jgi:hypothetical protein
MHGKGKESSDSSSQVKHTVTLALGAFGSASLEARARDMGVPAAAIARQAALYYLAERDSERAAVRVPRFARDARENGAGAEQPIELELDEADWAALEVEATHQRLPIERLLEHAVVLFLADIASGRMVMRILEEDEASSE